MDVLALKPPDLVFSESPKGWFRAYIGIERAVYSNWLLNESDISGSMWLLWFRHYLTGVGVGNQPYHAVIEWTRDKTLRAVSGLPLRTSTSWEIVSNGGTGVKSTVSTSTCNTGYLSALKEPLAKRNREQK